MTSAASDQDVLAYLGVLARAAGGRGWIEIRTQRVGEQRMRQEFFDVADLRAAAAAVLDRSREGDSYVADVYVGVAIRRDCGGGKSSLDEIQTLWVDCDNADSVAALSRFAPAPAMVVRSSARGCHGYWPLTSPLTIAAAERANRRLAHTLGACRSAVVNAAAILRPPQTWNLKYQPPAAVELLRLTGECFNARDVVGALSDPPGASASATSLPRDDGPAPEPLLEVEPSVYLETLTGRVTGRDGKAHCPLHPDTKPSFHCYATGMAGWFCFGCDRGGDVYDLGEFVLGIPRYGADFFRLRRALYDRLLPGLSMPPWRSRTELVGGRS